jgi:fatty-acyl-CoA synthase
VRQGFDPSGTTDPIYFNDPASQSFVRLDKDLYDRLQAGQVRV